MEWGSTGTLPGLLEQCQHGLKEDGKERGEVKAMVAHPGHVGVPGGDQVVAHAVHGPRQVLQRLGAHQAVCKVHQVQELGHRRHKRPVVVGQRLQHSTCTRLNL